MCFNNSLHQTAAAVRLSPVCIKPVSELQTQFKSDSSAAAVQLSPELSGLNEESLESTVSEQPDTVETHDKEIDYIEMTLNNHHLILMNKQESKQESVDFQEQDSHSDSQKSDETSIQEDIDFPPD